MVFDKIKSAINHIADVKNDTLDKIVSIIINGGGIVSKAKKAFVLKHINGVELAEIEKQAETGINIIRKKFSIDIQKVINKS